MKRFLKWAALLVVVAALGGLLAFLYFIPPFLTTPPEVFQKDMAEAPPTVDNIADPATRAIAARGRYIVMTSGCIGCHVGNGPQGPDLTKYLAGGGLKGRAARPHSNLGSFNIADSTAMLICPLGKNSRMSGVMSAQV